MKTNADITRFSIAELSEGDSFGEESNIADLKRNTSVTMITEGCLMRLNKIDFKELILRPILREVDFEEARNKVSQGANWLDARYPDEYQDYAIEGSLNIPLNVLRFHVDKLNLSTQYIVCCDTASRSSIAAYVLAQHGYDVLHLNKGLKVLLRHEDIEQIEPVVTTQVSENENSPDSTNVIPFKSSKDFKEDEHVLNSTFHEEVAKNRQGQEKTMLHIQDSINKCAR